MSPNKYLVPANERTSVTLTKSDLRAIQAYARTHQLTVVATLHRILKEGLLGLLAKEERINAKYSLKILKLGREFVAAKERKSKEAQSQNIKKVKDIPSESNRFNLGH
ncbi:hypothetical protein ACFLTP_04020 [Chloroflexota bacterium]